MRARLVFVMTLALATAGSAATIKVPQDYATIQDAIDAASNGDVVLVAPGTYVENIEFRSKAITVASSGGPASTIIDGGSPTNPDKGSVVRFVQGETIASVLDGFTLTNGSGTLSWDPDWKTGNRGGAVFVGASAAPTIRNNIIRQNNGKMGGGIHCHETSPIIEDNVILLNTADDFGGGICCYNGSPVITGNEISQNKAYQHGGGIACDEASDPVITDNVIQLNEVPWYGGGIFGDFDSAPVIKRNFIAYNIAHTASHASGGAGIYCRTGCAAIVEHNELFSNFAQVGGGLSAHVAATIRYNVIVENSATTFAGGVSLIGVGASMTGNVIQGNVAATNAGGVYLGAFGGNTLLVNNIIADNVAGTTGGGIYSSTNTKALVENCTVANNQAATWAAVHALSPDGLEIRSSIVWNNQSGSGGSINGASSVTYSDVEGGWAGTGNINVDPSFVDAAGLDYHLRYTSPCRDAGDPASTIAFDFERDLRTLVDMGADEFHLRLYHQGDTSPGKSAALKITANPSTSPVLLWVGAGVLDPPATSPYGDWYLAPPVLLTVYLGAIPAPDGVLVLPFTLSPSVPHPITLPLQAGVGAQLTNLHVIEID